MAHHHEALIETLNKMACAGVELRELAFAEKDYLALAADLEIDDPTAPVRPAMIRRKMYHSAADLCGQLTDEVVSIRVPDSFVFHGPTGAVRIRNVERGEVQVPRAMLRATAKLFPEGVAIDAECLERRIAELLEIEKTAKTPQPEIIKGLREAFGNEASDHAACLSIAEGAPLNGFKPTRPSHYAVMALRERCERAEANLMGQAKAVVVVDDHAISDEVLRQLKPGKVISLVELRNQGLVLRRVVEATAPVARVPNADAMRFTCADGTTVDVAMRALLRATADARSEKAAERRYETLSGDPLMAAAVTMATAPDRPQAALDAIRDVDALCAEQAQKERDLAANAHFRATHGEPGSGQRHDRIGSKCTLPHCPHPHDPAPANGTWESAASLVMTRWRSVPAELRLECVGCSSRLSYHALERLTSMGAHDIDHNCKTGELRLRLRDKSESKGLAAYLKSVVDRGEFFQFAKPLTDSEHRKQDLREWEKKDRATREDGPGIARLPEPRPEPLAFLDEDLLCEDE